MKISDILKQQGLFSKDIKIRIQSKQITLNGEPVDKDIEIEFTEMIDAGEFIFANFDIIQKSIELVKIVGFENLFSSNIKNELTDFLFKHQILRISKRELFVLK